MDAHDQCQRCFRYLHNPKAVEHEQVGGDHYAKKPLQPWDAMAVWMSAEQLEGFFRGCVIKYLARYRDKGGVTDLKKARHYLDKLIDHVEPTS